MLPVWLKVAKTRVRSLAAISWPAFAETGSTGRNAHLNLGRMASAAADEEEEVEEVEVGVVDGVKRPLEPDPLTPEVLAPLEDEDCARPLPRAVLGLPRPRPRRLPGKFWLARRRAAPRRGARGITCKDAAD